MYDELKKVCEEILSDEIKTKEFLAMSSIEEMYNFFKGKIPNLSTSEFDDFIVELLENYERMQLEGNTIDAEMLQNVSGGAKFGSKVTAASLALLMGMPAGGAHASATDGANKFSAAVKNVGRKISNTSSRYGNRLAETSLAKKFPKASAWLKNHPHIASAVSAVLILAAIAGVTYGTVKLKNHYFPGAQTPTEDKKEDKKEEIVDLKSIVSDLNDKLPEGIYASVKELIDEGKYDEAASVLAKTPFEGLSSEQQKILVNCSKYLSDLRSSNQSSETAIAGDEDAVKPEAAAAGEGEGEKNPEGEAAGDEDAVKPEAAGKKDEEEPKVEEPNKGKPEDTSNP